MRQIIKRACIGLGILACVPILGEAAILLWRLANVISTGIDWAFSDGVTGFEAGLIKATTVGVIVALILFVVFGRYWVHYMVAKRKAA